MHSWRTGHCLNFPEDALCIGVGIPLRVHGLPEAIQFLITLRGLPISFLLFYDPWASSADMPEVSQTVSNHCYLLTTLTWTPKHVPSPGDCVVVWLCAG